ncbi:MAG: PAS domain-containing protein [Acidobacteriota bacterium]|nr:PAS domain-containing protein [Acidobacteriota bacterium]
MREIRFWVIQAMVVFFAIVHLVIDLHVSAETGAFPSGLPVALLIVPVGYAALQYGLAGASGTALWAIVLWLPDLFLSRDRGHAGADLIDLALVVLVAVVFGRRMDAERLTHEKVERAMATSLALETRFHRLFETNHSPIIVFDRDGVVSDANPAAQSLFGADVIGTTESTLLELGAAPAELAGQVVSLRDGHDYRLDVAVLHGDEGGPSTQVILEDVTAERTEGRLARRYAQLVVEAEEDQRGRLARELHDEPLQLFLHLARRIESLGRADGVPPEVSDSLEVAHHQALDAARRLRTLARDLRPPTLDQLGLVAAVSTLVADVEDEGDVTAELLVHGHERRLAPEIELGAFRIVQEAVRNCLRHAHASTVTVSLDFRDAELLVVVTDDGVGLGPSGNDGGDPEHLGILGMRERARLLGGRLEVTSSPGDGVAVTSRIPTPGAQPA